MSSSSVADTIKLNFNGFSTKVLINDEAVSAIDTSISFTENILNFEGAYGGCMNYKTEDKEDEEYEYSSNNYFRMNTIGMYELPEISCSIGIEMLYSQIWNLFFDFLKNRGNPVEVEIFTGDKKPFYYPNCFFKSLNMSASQGSLLTSKYDFYVFPFVDNNKSNVFYDSIQNNVLQTNSNLPVFNMTPSTNENGNENLLPIGFWETEISGFTIDGKDKNGNEKEKKVLDWSLNFSQNIIPKYYCCGSSSDEPPLPNIMIGYPKLELNVTFLIDDTEFNEKIFAKLQPPFSNKKYNNRFNEESNVNKKLTLKVRGKKICDFETGFVTSHSPSLVSNSGITYSVSYLINKIKLYNIEDNE